uniref:Formamidopyrimidine-DNA glycosylase catalytic domain-containing protein n=1 Tax=Ananas comosus var. bracteatus TaxID=296719 RepID=A0A6V7PM12_ANACO|nr:unnamed protein product [Ananas comosus var. bracteatus]
MPELPEVEAARRALERHCVGRRIVGCCVADDPKVVVGVGVGVSPPSLLGRTILAAGRRGKNLWLRLDSPPSPPSTSVTPNPHTPPPPLSLSLYSPLLNRDIRREKFIESPIGD